jgi:phosphatidylserine decarboxylase
LIKAWFRLLTELSSRKFVSRTTGKIAKSRFSRRWIASFAKTYAIAVEEAEKPLEQYESLNEFFTRRLKPDSRQIDPAPDAVVSPVDARITGAGEIREGQLLNIKGQDYTLEELLGRSPRIVNYTHGFYVILYLSPADYHRIHVPAAGKIVEREHLPGKTYPVNEYGMRNIRRVLSRNERLITYLQTAAGEIAMVKVGALNVSSIRYTEPQRDVVDKGDELAYFEFGSTVVLLFENGIFTPRSDLMINLQVKMGEAIGTLRK